MGHNHMGAPMGLNLGAQSPTWWTAIAGIARRSAAQLRLLKSSLPLALGVTVLAWVLLRYYQELTGNPVDLSQVQSVLEKYLVLGVVPASLALWSDLDGKRPGLFLTLPVSRLEMVVVRTLIPTLLWALLATLTLAYVDGFVLELGQDQALPMLGRSWLVAVFLLSLTSFLSTMARSPVAGAGGVLLYWLLHYLLGPSKIGARFYLFQGSLTMQSAGRPGQELATNREVLIAASIIMALASWLLLRSTQRFLGKN